MVRGSLRREGPAGAADHPGAGRCRGPTARRSGASGHRPRCGPVGSGRWSVPSSALRSRMVPLTRPRGSDHHAGHAGHRRRRPSVPRDRIALARGPPRPACCCCVAGVDARLAGPRHPARQPVHPDGRPTPSRRCVGGIAVWGFAIVVPAAFLIIGFARLASPIEAATALRPRRVTPTLAKALGPGPPRRDRPPAARRPPDPRARARPVRDRGPGRRAARRR